MVFIMKKIFAILITCLLVVVTAYSVLGIYDPNDPDFYPPDGCYTPKLVKSFQGTLYVGEGQNMAAYDFPKYDENCYYRFTLEAKTDNCVEVLFNVGRGQNGGQESEFGLPDKQGNYTHYIESYWNPKWPPPETIEIRVFGEVCEIPGSVEYTIQVYEECACNKTVLYPKVDIEQFSVAGGPTVIQDGKVISNFTMSPGSQQVMLQVENRGFFTQKDAMVKFEGLPSGVEVEITPETQILKAHNIGTYSATFTVDPNVPSGTYQVKMIAYSPSGVFDTITFEFVVP